MQYSRICQGTAFSFDYEKNFENGNHIRYIESDLILTMLNDKFSTTKFIAASYLYYLWLGLYYLRIILGNYLIHLVENFARKNRNRLLGNYFSAV